MVVRVPKVLDRFARYHEQGWRVLSPVLTEGHLDDFTIHCCRDNAIKCGDMQGAALADLLLVMSKGQRQAIKKFAADMEH